MNPAEFTLNTSPSLTKAIPALSFKTSLNAGLSKEIYPRVNLEPIYTQLKAALGDQWAEYKACLGQYVLGNLNQAELSWVLQPMLSATSAMNAGGEGARTTASTLYLHNTLVAAIYANTLRDPPPTEVAPWVVATDKPTASSKSAGAGSGASDQVEERQKHEVMSLHPRDRKRIKAVKETGKTVNGGLQEMLEYHNELAVKPPSQSQTAADGVTPQSATATGMGGRGELETRRRYAQTLASETLEFPSLEAIQARIEPICYEEGLAGGVQQGQQQQCAELVEQAAEVYIKEMLATLLKNTRSNAPGGVGIQTHQYKRQVHKEERDAERGSLQRNAAGLLPVEVEMQAKKEALGMDDMRLALGLSNPYLRAYPFLKESIFLEDYPQIDLDPNINGLLSSNGNGGTHAAINGILPDADAMAIDDDLGSWRGATNGDRDGLLGSLDECLLAAG